jgi:hypothetical protein
MAAASQLPPSHPPAERRFGSPRAEAGSTHAGSRLAYRAALSRYKGARLAAIRLAQGALPDGSRIRPVGSADEIAEHLDQGAAVGALVARLSVDSRLALSLFALTETTTISMAGLTHALGILGVEPIVATVRLLELGLLAIDPGPELWPVDDFHTVLERGNPAQVRLRVHPVVPHGVRTARPEGGLLKVAGPVSQVRESDGLEPLLRLGALWQRVGAEPLRQTNQGMLYKRDRERVSEDVVLTGPVADALGPLPDPAALWLALGRHVGLIELDPTGERLLAAPPEFWTDNAVHLPQMIATGWMAMRTWQESEGMTVAKTEASLAVPYLRIAVMLWLAALGDSDWVAVDDLAEHLSSRWPRWDRVSLLEEPARALTLPKGGKSPRNRAGAERTVLGLRLLETLLLGAAYPLGLVRAAEEQGSRRRVVQLTPLGRYVLALGPTPPPGTTFEHFLFVQPNFEVIAYRQGLTPQLVGWLSRFALWSQIGAALELKLTRESIVHGLDTGSTPAAILEKLTRHTQRPLPPGVVDAIRNWATRRERVTYYAAATLIEFGSTRERDEARAFWPADELAAPIDVGDRFLLVADDRTVPFDRLRLIASRDYRRPPEVCVTVETDGVSLVLDPARSDLLVDAELARFADEQPADPPLRGEARGPALRRFVVTVASMRRGLGRGMSAPQFGEWYARRTGAGVPAAVRLLLAPKISRVPPLRAARIVVLNLPNSDLLDGLVQHPATRPLLGDRLGPTAVTVTDDQLGPLQKALKGLGIDLAID